MLGQCFEKYGASALTCLSFGNMVKNTEFIKPMQEINTYYRIRA